MLQFPVETHQYQLNLKTLLQAYRCEGKEIVLNIGWLCTCSKIGFGSFLTKKKLQTAALNIYEIFVVTV